MKRIISIILITLLALTFTACDSSDQPKETKPGLTESVPVSSTLSTAGHEHQYRSQVTKEATCAENGEMILICDCGNTYTEYIPPLEHTWSDWYEESGQAKRVCSVCDAEEYKELDALAIEQEIEAYMQLMPDLPEFDDPSELTASQVLQWLRGKVETVSYVWDETTSMATYVYSIDTINEFTAYYLGQTYDIASLAQTDAELTYDAENDQLIWVTGSEGDCYTYELGQIDEMGDGLYYVQYRIPDKEETFGSFGGKISLVRKDGRLVFESHSMWIVVNEGGAGS